MCLQAAPRKINNTHSSKPADMNLTGKQKMKTKYDAGGN